MKTINKVYTFGCSFTKWYWPTWSDIIKKDLEVPLENWAIPGIGNVAISHLVLECDLTCNFKNSDLILVGWSNWTREDRYNSGWHKGGNIFTNTFYDKEFVKKYWSNDNDCMKNMTAIIYTNKIFQIAYQFHIHEYIGHNLNDENIQKLSYLVTNMPKKDIFDINTNSFFNNALVNIDNHPDIQCHINHVKKIYSKIGMKLKKDTENYYLDLHKDISYKLEKYKVKDFNQSKIFFQDYFNFDPNNSNQLDTPIKGLRA